MTSHSHPHPAQGADSLGEEARAAARALKRKGPVAEWLAPKVAAEHAPVHLVPTALILEISPVLCAQLSDVPVTTRAGALVDSDLDQLIRRAAKTVRSMRRRAVTGAAVALAC